jgi:hypothetical protein
MYNHNYKNLKYKDSIIQFIKDYKWKYIIYGRYTIWNTKNGKSIMIKNLNKEHLKNIINLFGNTYIRVNYPFIFYRFAKEIEIKRLESRC